MATLSKEHRKLLENTVAAARKIAVAGAEKALLALRVGDKEAPSDPGQKELRSQLRAHGRQLGDRRQPNGTQETVRLEQAVAYEHWHRLLFARFLAENDLLVNPEFGVPMSLAEVQEAAREQNCDWLSLASGYAQRMLLEVFRPDDPVLRVALPPESRQQLEEKLNTLPVEIFRADDSLGWVYQFWQRDEKDRVNKSEVKIGANELPAVTQLFTEDYMVLFLLENTLGAWWAAKRWKEGKDSTLPGYEWTYLRLNEDGSPTAGGFDGWPRLARDVRVLDPSMGSGHFLTFAMPMLTRMRIKEEGVSLRDAVYSVLRDNLFGLELDARCSQIAAFNLALAAWRLAGEYFPLPQLNLACSGLGIHAPESNWIDLAGDDGQAREEMRRLYSLFRDAPTLGSLIDPLRLEANVFASGARRVLPLLEEALTQERGTDDTHELLITAQGVLAAFRILAAQFTLVATNVPYLGRGKQHELLASYCAEFHSDAKADLATCFVDRCLRFCDEGGSAALVTPQNWLFLTSYKRFRERTLAREQWDFIARLGEHAFDSAAAAGAFVTLVGLTRIVTSAEHSLVGWDASGSGYPADKAKDLKQIDARRARQSDQRSNPDARITLEAPDAKPLLSQYANAYWGQGTGDFPRFGRYFWEVPYVTEDYDFMQSTVVRTTEWGGREFVIYWQGGNGELVKLAEDLRERLKNIHRRGQEAWGKAGVTVSLMRDLPVTLYGGQIFDGNCAAIIPKDPSHVPAVWTFCKAPEFLESVRRIDQKVNVTNHTLLKVPFDLDYWTMQASLEYPQGLPLPSSNDSSQWLFDGDSKAATRPLQSAVARLLGYRWPRQTATQLHGASTAVPDGLDQYADADGVVGLSALTGEASAADRLRTLLAQVYGADWSATRLAQLTSGSESLEIWLRDKYFEAHCEEFCHCPFVWHVWDGRKDGFHALVSYHKLAAPNGEGRKTLERLIYTSVGDWIRRQAEEVKRGADGAEARLTAAEHLKTELTKILHGEPPYDLFIRWKPLHQQPMGWDPDVNDGVRLNMRPWLNAKPYVQPGQKQKQDACILRVTPIKLPLGKDRGKEPLRDKDEFPWYATSQDRTNDIHFTLEEKREARERKKKA